MVSLIFFVVAYQAEAWAQTLPTLQSLPQEVQAAIQEAVRDCEPEKVTLKWGFIVEKDVNGDSDIPSFFRGPKCNRRLAF